MKISLEELAGAHSELINHPHCKQDKAIHQCIGTSMVMTGALSLISSSFAISTFITPIAAVPLGVIVAGSFVTLDRFLMLSERKLRPLRERVIPAVVRIILGVASAHVISIPVSLFIFRAEVHAEIAVIELEEKQATTNALQAPLEGERERLRKERGSLEKHRDKQVNEMMGEAEGTSGSGLVGKGYLYHEKRAEVGRTTRRIEEIDTELASITAKIEEEHKAITSKLDRAHSTSLLTQVKALHHLQQRDETINAIVTGISLLLIGIDVAPLLAKISSPASVYDVALESGEAVAKRGYQIEQRAAYEQQDFDYQESKKCMISVRSTFHHTVADTTNAIIAEAVQSPRYALVRRTYVEKSIAALCGAMETLMGEMLLPITSRVEDTISGQPLPPLQPFVEEHQDDAPLYTLDGLLGDEEDSLGKENGKSHYTLIT